MNLTPVARSSGGYMTESQLRRYQVQILFGMPAAATEVSVVFHVVIARMAVSIVSGLLAGLKG